MKIRMVDIYCELINIEFKQIANLHNLFKEHVPKFIKNFKLNYLYSKMSIDKLLNILSNLSFF